jgi:hypothetical protein
MLAVVDNLWHDRHNVINILMSNPEVIIKGQLHDSWIMDDQQSSLERRW